MHYFLGDKWAVKGGILDPNMYLGLVTIHGTIMVFFLLTGGLSGTFANLLIPLQVGARDMASPFLNMLSYWFFLIASVMMFISLFVETGPGFSRMDNISSTERSSASYSRFNCRHDLMAWHLYPCLLFLPSWRA
jgi:heme/copper-type cytochrome/quinol oxidase subunit 1